jgi:hypothetical protein
MGHITKRILVYPYESVKRGYPWRKKRTFTAVILLSCLLLIAPMSWDISSENQVDLQETSLQ